MQRLRWLVMIYFMLISRKYVDVNGWESTHVRGLGENSILQHDGSLTMYFGTVNETRGTSEAVVRQG